MPEAGPRGPGHQDRDGPPTLTRIFDSWVDTDLKIHLVVFFRENPGVMETIEGLGRRLGMPSSAIDLALKDHIELGIIKKRPVGDKELLIFDRTRDADIQELVQEAFNAATQSASSAGGAR